MGSVFYGSVRTVATAWAFGDLGVVFMAWLNIVAILVLRRPRLASGAMTFEGLAEGQIVTQVARRIGILPSH